MHQLEDHLQHRCSTSELAFCIRALNWDMHVDVLFIICCRTRLLGAHCTPLQFSFLNSFAKLWKASLSFVTSVRPYAWNNSIPTDFDETRYLSFFRKSVKMIQVSLKSEKNGVFYMKTFSLLWQYFAEFFWNDKFWNKSCRENQNTTFMFSNFCPKSVLFMILCLKMWWNQRGRKWQYGCALHVGLVRLTRASARTRTHTHTHTDI